MRLNASLAASRAKRSVSNSCWPACCSSRRSSCTSTPCGSRERPCDAQIQRGDRGLEAFTAPSSDSCTAAVTCCSSCSSLCSIRAPQTGPWTLRPPRQDPAGGDGSCPDRPVRGRSPITPPASDGLHPRRAALLQLAIRTPSQIGAASSPSGCSSPYQCSCPAQTAGTAGL